jgi:hypothetical protein
MTLKRNGTVSLDEFCMDGFDLTSRRRALGRLAHQAALGDPTSSTNSVLTPFVTLFDLPHRCRW